MVKKMIYLEEAMEHALKRVAHAENKSVSHLIRKAIQRLLESEEHYDLSLYDKRMAEYLGKPASAVSFRGMMDQ